MEKLIGLDILNLYFDHLRGAIVVVHGDGMRPNFSVLMTDGKIDAVYGSHWIRGPIEAAEATDDRASITTRAGTCIIQTRGGPLEFYQTIAWSPSYDVKPLKDF